MAQFSDTTNKNGLIQKFEFWARLQDGEVTGTLLKQITDRINSAFENIMPLLLAYDDQIRWDDINNTDAPVGTTDIVSGQSDYKITVDDNSYDILNITHARVYQTSTGTTYYDLDRMTADDPLVTRAISPDSNETGIPTHFLELGNTVYLWPQPNYAATNGLQIFFSRQQQYFTSSDTTKEPGIPLPFHELLVLYAALDYITVFRPEDGSQITLISQRIKRKEQELKNFIDMRNPVRIKIEIKPIKFR